MRLALAVSQGAGDLPPGEIALAEALQSLGAEANPVIWSDPSVDWAAFDAIVVRSCWDYHLRLLEFLAWTEALETMDIPVLNPVPLIRWNSTKRYLQYFGKRGISIPDTVWVDDGQSIDLQVTCRDRHWPSAVVKPLVSASAHETERAASGRVRGPRLVQEYLPEIETSGEISLVYFGGTFSHAVCKLPAEGDFRVQEEHGGSTRVVIARPDLQLFGTAALRALPCLPAFARVDAVERGGAPLLMELELIEPELFVTLAEGAAARLAEALLRAL